MINADYALLITVLIAALQSTGLFKNTWLAVGLWSATGMLLFPIVWKGRPRSFLMKMFITLFSCSVIIVICYRIRYAADMRPGRAEVSFFSTDGRERPFKSVEEPFRNMSAARNLLAQAKAEVPYSPIKIDMANPLPVVHVSVRNTGAIALHHVFIVVSSSTLIFRQSPAQQFIARDQVGYQGNDLEPYSIAEDEIDLRIGVQVDRPFQDAQMLVTVEADELEPMASVTNLFFAKVARRLEP